MQMRSSACWLFACQAVVAFAGLPTVAAADDIETCAEGSSDVAIAACSRAIGSGRYTGHDLAILLGNRGVGYGGKGDYDPALSDYDQAIRLEPKNTPPYTKPR